MELKDYLKEKKLTQTSFIKEVEAKTKVKIPQGTLAKWVLGVRIPRKKEMLILRDITNGEVQPNDFYK
jgi:transcriptional regulator with XRE-family HTH domain|tara:strand:+ start:375 stop:578 length:204 start_codon:yes stop_codon:yes gene_type:complete